MIPSWLLTASAILAAIVAIPYVLGPLLIFSSLRFRMPPKVLAIDPRQEPLPASAREFFERTYQAFTTLGFRYVGTIGLPDMVPNVRSIFAMYSHRESSDLAMAAIIVGDGGMMSELKTCYVEFVRKFDDGVVVQTNNSTQLNSFKTLPDEHTVKFWDIQDLPRLYQLHRRLSERLCRSGRPVNRLATQYGDDVVRYVSEVVLDETFRRQIGTGYLAACPAGYRPTVFGALVMTWSELFPWKSMRKSAERRKAAKWLAELE